MTKRICAIMVTVVFLAGVIGTTQAATYNAREDCCTEGPPYIRDSKQSPVVKTIVVDKGSMYIEGMGFTPCPQEPKTIVPKVSNIYDFCSEGFSEEELEELLHIRTINNTVPAAGN